MLAALGYSCAEMRQLADTFGRLSKKKDKSSATRASAATQSASWSAQAAVCEAATLTPSGSPNVSVNAYNQYGQIVTLSVPLDQYGNPILPAGFTLTVPGSTVTPPISTGMTTITAMNQYGQPVTITVNVDAYGNPVLPTGYTLIGTSGTSGMTTVTALNQYGQQVQLQVQIVNGQPVLPPGYTMPTQSVQPTFPPNTSQTLTLMNPYNQAVTLTVTIDQFGHAILPQGYNFMPQQQAASPYGLLPEQQYVSVQTQAGPVLTPMDELDQGPAAASATAAAPKEKGGGFGLNTGTIVLFAAGGALVWYIMKHSKRG